MVGFFVGFLFFFCPSFNQPLSWWEIQNPPTTETKEVNPPFLFLLPGSQNASPNKCSYPGIWVLREWGKDEVMANFIHKRGYSGVTGTINTSCCWQACFLPQAGWILEVRNYNWIVENSSVLHPPCTHRSWEHFLNCAQRATLNYTSISSALHLLLSEGDFQWIL